MELNKEKITTGYGDTYFKDICWDIEITEWAVDKK